jgi:hypothetical protein
VTIPPIVVTIPTVTITIPIVVVVTVAFVILVLLEPIFLVTLVVLQFIKSRLFEPKDFEHAKMISGN